MIFVGVWGVGGPTASYIDVQSASGNSFSIGTAASDRRIFSVVHWSETGAVHRTLSSASIGGVSATIHLQQGHSGGSSGFGVALISAIVPTGTTASVATAYSGAIFNETYGVFSAYGLQDSSPTDVADNTSAGSSTSISATITVPAQGVLIAGYSASELSGNAVTWTGVTENYDSGGGGGYARSAGFLVYPSGSGSQTVGITKSSEINSGNAFVAVSWK